MGAERSQQEGSKREGRGAHVKHPVSPEVLVHVRGALDPWRPALHAQRLAHLHDMHALSCRTPSRHGANPLPTPTALLYSHSVVCSRRVSGDCHHTASHQTDACFTSSQPWPHVQAVLAVVMRGVSDDDWRAATPAVRSQVHCNYRDGAGNAGDSAIQYAETCQVPVTEMTAASRSRSHCPAPHCHIALTSSWH